MRIGPRTLHLRSQERAADTHGTPTAAQAMSATVAMSCALASSVYLPCADPETWTREHTQVTSSSDTASTTGDQVRPVHSCIVVMQRTTWPGDEHARHAAIRCGRPAPCPTLRNQRYSSSSSGVSPRAALGAVVTVAAMSMLPPQRAPFELTRGLLFVTRGTPHHELRQPARMDTLRRRRVQHLRVVV